MLEHLTASLKINFQRGFAGKFHVHVPGTVSYVTPSLFHHLQFQDKQCLLCLCSGTH